MPPPHAATQAYPSLGAATCTATRPATHGACPPLPSPLGRCERCEMSWTEKLHVPGEPGGQHPGSPVHIYTRKAPPQSVAEMRALVDSELDREADGDTEGGARGAAQQVLRWPG